MSKVDICHCLIKRDDRTTIWRGEHNPMPYPEVEMARFAFGDKNVSEVTVVGYRERNNQDVLEDLRIKYGAQQVAKAFPGTRPRLPLEAPDDTRSVAKSKLIDFDARDAQAEASYEARRDKNLTLGDKLEADRKAGVVAAE